jgi:hypothetical protein
MVLLLGILRLARKRVSCVTWFSSCRLIKYSAEPQRLFTILSEWECRRKKAWVQRVQEVSEGNRGYVGWQTRFIYKNSAHLHQTGVGHGLID